MRVNKPIIPTDATLTDCSVSEPSSGESVYSGTTNYKAGDRVVNTTTHRSYESLHGIDATVTLTIASPCVVTWVNHGIPAGTQVVFSTTGALPTGLTAGTAYYVLADTADTFKVSATIGGSAINTSGSQSGVHTAIADPNRGHDPTTDLTELHWRDVGASNKWAAVDLDRNGYAEDASPMFYEFTPGERIDAIGVYGMLADTITIEVKVSGVTKWSYTANLLDRMTTGWYGYFFNPFRYRRYLALFEIPPYSGAVITVTYTRASGDVRSGRIVLGRGVYLGVTLAEAEREGLNFSKIDNNAITGDTVLIKKRTVPTTNQTVIADKDAVPTLLTLIEDLNAVPALWSWIDDQESGFFPAGVILGVYTQLKITADQPNTARVALSLKEV